MMEGIKDLIVEGEGALLIFDRPSVFRDVEYWRVEISPDYGSFRIRNCERVKLRNFSVDWDWERDPLAAFVRVTKVHIDNVATNASYFEAEFVDYDRYPTYPRPLSIQTMADMDGTIWLAGTPGCTFEPEPEDPPDPPGPPELPELPPEPP